jgi:RNA polymerase sigma-70 factor (ECF subfamily)
MSAAPPLSATTRDSQATQREQEIIESSRTGDLNAFDQLVVAHQDRIYNLCYWILGHRDDASDATQDAFIRAFRSLDSFRGDSAFGTWLHRIAVNACLDVLQRRKRAPQTYTDLESDSENSPQSDKIAERSSGEANRRLDPARLSAQRERRKVVQEALAQIPEHYRLALVLYDIEGHSYDEIAQTLKLPLGTIKSRINRARLALREHLENKRELFEE